MAYTVSDLDALEKAIATGALRVQYADKTVEYRSLSEMLQIKKIMESELNSTAAARNNGRRFGAFQNGIK